MKFRILLVLFILSIPLPAGFGAFSIYLQNDLSQTSNATGYSLEERLLLFDKLIAKLEKNGLDKRAIIENLKIQKDLAIASSEFESSLQNISRKSYFLLFAFVCLQFSLGWLAYRELKQNGKIT